MRDICGECFFKQLAVIGGVGHVVEIDERAWTKRKYGRGRAASTRWIFGGVARDTGEYFAVLQERRDATTLSPIINQYIRPGTTIYNDQWSAYNSTVIGQNQYTHQTVNRSYSFVDPSILVHTQNMENMWMRMKRKKKAQMGQHVSLLGANVIEFMWRQQIVKHPFENPVRCIQDKYSVQFIFNKFVVHCTRTSFLLRALIERTNAPIVFSPCLLYTLTMSGAHVV